ncbi:patatin-like phospholipase family protein [Chungangia koreensis]|uniref:Patatin-like phospholipase family protein n=1 Tax=Chungangia koreensis TaxID=752657 RepID=A0ABV8X257_9LACT
MYIDGVFSGGGLKGFALLGAYQVLEENGIRFNRVAGTSAGSIVAAFIAAGYTAKEIEAMLDEINLKTFLDPRKAVLPLPFTKWLNLYFKMGLYQGKVLEQWLFDKLAAKNIYSFGDLPEDSLKIVASDLSNGKMLIFPDDLPEYGIYPERFPVFRAIRMSCGIPFFFEPVKMKTRNGRNIVVDGGVLSNFPLWIFDDEEGKRERPVLGLKLSRSTSEKKMREIDNGLQLFEALFATMKDAHDERYISRKFERDIIFIPVEDYNSIQFDLNEEMKNELIQKGRKRTTEFLNSWYCYSKKPGVLI